MKKLVGVLILFLMNGTSFSDISVHLINGDKPFYVAGTTEYVDTAYVDTAFVQLIWSSTSNAQATAEEVGEDGSGNLGFGEYLLQSLTPSGLAGTWTDTSSEIYTDADVGGQNIAEGYIFVRIFDASAMDVGDYYLQQYLQGPSLTEFSITDTTSIYQTSGSLGGLAFDDADLGHTIDVVPEPAVISLIGLFGGGMLITRRLFAKG